MEAIDPFGCPNSPCPDQGVRGKGNLDFRGWSGTGQRIRMISGRTCQKSFSERKGTVLERSQ